MTTFRALLIPTLALGAASGLLPVTPAAQARADGIEWRYEYTAARKEAIDKGRPMLLDFGTENCFWCRQLDLRTFVDPNIVRMLNQQFVPIKVDANRNPTLAEALRIQNYPTLVFASSDGRVLGSQEGFVEAPVLKDLLDRVLAVAEPEWMLRNYQEACKAREAGNFDKALTLVKPILEDGKSRPIQARAAQLLRELEQLAAAQVAPPPPPLARANPPTNPQGPPKAGTTAPAPQPTRVVEAVKPPEPPKVAQPIKPPEAPRVVEAVIPPQPTRVVEAVKPPEQPKVVQPIKPPEAPRVVEAVIPPQPTRVVEAVQPPDPPKVVIPSPSVPEPPRIVAMIRPSEPDRVTEPVRVVERPEPAVPEGQEDSRAVVAMTEVARVIKAALASRQGAQMLVTLASRSESPEMMRVRQAQDLLSQAREDYRRQQYLACLDRCETLLSSYADLSESLEANSMAAEIHKNPEWIKLACDQLNERLSLMYLNLADTWLKKGQPQQAIFYLERVMVTAPNTRYAETAQVRLAQLQGQPMLHGPDQKR